MNILNVSGLHKSFGEHEVIKGVSFALEQGETLAVIGPSGSGKSTILRCISQLEKIDAGQISICGKDMIMGDGSYAPRAQLEEIRRSVGMVFQNFNLFPHMSVLRNITEAPVRVLGMNKDEAESKALELLSQMGLENKKDNYPCELSGGQQQRTSIGRAIVKNPDILLCDEPTGALDYNTSKEILSLIEKVNQTYGNTVIMVTHNDAIKNMADRVIRLRDGMIRKNYINENKIPASDLEW